ncbi:unnamed protein product [Phytophthora fragariaefolia]|uniref:Unnamed protein product n=1 Tax=Phytophthora fragariaefolia TaxID=1490495 RepID=A0A9W7CZ42_9STRA|nr:unnamed protein product [Phytophthora fragariaefolia]
MERGRARACQRMSGRHSEHGFCRVGPSRRLVPPAGVAVIVLFCQPPSELGSNYSGWCTRTTRPRDSLLREATGTASLSLDTSSADSPQQTTVDISLCNLHSTNNEPPIHVGIREFQLQNVRVRHKITLVYRAYEADSQRMFNTRGPKFSDS